MSRTSQAMSYKVLLEHYPYRYIIMDTLLANGYPDCRMQKHYTHDGWVDEYLFDNQMQMTKRWKITTIHVGWLMIQLTKKMSSKTLIQTDEFHFLSNLWDGPSLCP